MAAKNSAPDTGSERSNKVVLLTRLKKRRDFLAARNGARSHERAFVLQMARNCEAGDNFRVGFTVTKKVGNSVVRNRIKRRLREAVDQAFLRQSNQHEFAGFDGVLIARELAKTIPFPSLIDEIDRAMRRCLKRTVANHSASGQKRRQQSAQGAS